MKKKEEKKYYCKGKEEKKFPHYQTKRDVILKDEREDKERRKIR